MGSGYWILVWDGFSAGLVMLEPRLLVEGEDFYGNPRNWWPCDKGATNEDIDAKHSLTKRFGDSFKILRD